MTMSEITNKLKYDISDALRRVAGKLPFRKASCRSARKDRVARLPQPAIGPA
jgi:hypothetical protein